MFDPNPKLTEERVKSNAKILEILKAFLEEHPDMRFGQALLNLGIILNDRDPWHEESKHILDRTKSTAEALTKAIEASKCK